jgi:hypothetical protein
LQNLSAFGKIKPDKVKGESGLGNQIWLAESESFQGYIQFGCNLKRGNLDNLPNIGTFKKSKE